MNPGLQRLRPYPFERLRGLTAGLPEPTRGPVLNFAIGEPQDPPPAFIGQALADNLAGLGSYPSSAGAPALRQAIARWLTRRFNLPAASLDPDRHILPANGTREALFSVAQCLAGNGDLVALPNPGYQIYEGAALLSGAEPLYLTHDREHSLLDSLEALSDSRRDRIALLYVCSPDNPTGHTLTAEQWQRIWHLAQVHDFYIAADECYSEIYADESAPPTGLLQALAALGETTYPRALVFHSLSKRSGVPGLRSGFVAGDAHLIAAFGRYRTYHGATMAPPIQAASTLAWQDETHVAINRQRYRERFAVMTEALAPLLPVSQPAGGFYLWLPTAASELEIAGRLYSEQALLTLPGRYLGRDDERGNPAAGYLRLALVWPAEVCRDAAQRIAAVWTTRS